MLDVTCDHALFKRLFTKYATSLIVDISFPPSNMKDPVLKIKIVGKDFSLKSFFGFKNKAGNIELV